VDKVYGHRDNCLTAEVAGVLRSLK
jgi:hypothetical protein